MDDDKDVKQAAAFAAAERKKEKQEEKQQPREKKTKEKQKREAGSRKNESLSAIELVNSTRQHVHIQLFNKFISIVLWFGVA